MAALVIAFGTLGYWLVLGWSFSDALFMTLTTIATIGYSEVRPLDATGRAFTIVLILFGVGTALYAFTMIAQFVVEGEVRNLFRRNRMEREAARLSRHVIICGYGRMGKIVTEELHQRRFPLIVIEQQPDKTQEILELGGLVIQGDATSDEVLRKAGIERARAIVCVVESDAENLYITLSARELNPEIFVLARCTEDAAAEKLRRAGADKVIFPYRLGARQMAEVIARPPPDGVHRDGARQGKPPSGNARDVGPGGLLSGRLDPGFVGPPEELQPHCRRGAARPAARDGVQSGDGIPSLRPRHPPPDGRTGPDGPAHGRPGRGRPAPTSKKK